MNPMIMILLVPLGIIFLMQRIQASIDPEELENVLGGGKV